MKSERAICFDSIDQNLLLSMALISSFLQIDTWSVLRPLKVVTGMLQIHFWKKFDLQLLKKRAYRRGKLSINTVLRLLPGVRVCIWSSSSMDTLPLLPPCYPSDIYIYYPFDRFAEITRYFVADALSSENKGLHIIDFSSIMFDPGRWIY